MTVPFDFASLAATAADVPDALLLADIERLYDLHRHLRRQKRIRDIAPASQACRDLAALIERQRPVTLAGIVAKLQLVQAVEPAGPIFVVPQAAVADALAWIAPNAAKPRRRRKEARP